MLSRPPTRPPLITPSASPPPQPSSSQNNLPSPSKRQRTLSHSSNARRSVSVAESTLDFSKERESSIARLLGTWSHLAGRYSRRLDEDDIVDIRTGEIVKDNGFWKASRKFNFGEALQREDTEDSVGDDSEDDEGIDELDAFEEGRHYIEDGFAKDLQQKLLTHADNGAATDLDEFLEAEQRRKKEYGSDVEEDELKLPLEHRRSQRSPLSATSDSNGEEGSSDTSGPDALSPRAPESYWEEQESEGNYDNSDDDTDELDNWDPIEGSKIIPVRAWNSSPPAGASESDEMPAKNPLLPSSKRRTPPLQICTPPSSYSLPNSSDSEPVFSPRPPPADNTLGSAYSHEATSISPPSSPSKSRPTRPQSVSRQAPALEIIEITDDESPETPGNPAKSTSSPSLSPPRLSASSQRRSVVPEVVITTLPPRSATIKRHTVTTPSTSGKLGTTTSTKRAPRPTAPQFIHSAKNAKKTVVTGTPTKPSPPSGVAKKATVSGTLSSSITPARQTKKITSTTTSTKPPSARKPTQKPKKATVHAKTKITTPLAVTSNMYSDDAQDAPESYLLHQPERIGQEAGGHPATPSSPAYDSIEPQASKSPPAKRKGRKRRRSSSTYEVAGSAKTQASSPSSPRETTSRGSVRASSAAPRRSSRRSLSRSKHLSDDDGRLSSSEEVNYKRHSRFTPASTAPRVQLPYVPHTPTHHSGAYPPIVDARAQHIITQAMHQLATLFWTPTHPLSADPMYPYAPRHAYSSVGSNFMPSTPDHPHPYPFNFDPSLSAGSLPPSSSEPPSSPLKPRERRKSLVPRSYSRGRKVSFRAGENDTESSEDEALGSGHRSTGNNSIPNEGYSSPSRLKRKGKGKGKGKEQADTQRETSSGSEQEDSENNTASANVKNARAAAASVQEPRAGRSMKGRLMSGSSDVRSPKKPSNFRKNYGGSDDRL